MQADGDLDARLRAALAASRELGAEYDSAMVDSIRKLVTEHEIEPPKPVTPARPARSAQATLTMPRRRRFGGRGLAIVSLVLAIPLSAIAGAFGHVEGITVCWAGVVLVNVADRLSQRRGELDR